MKFDLKHPDVPPGGAAPDYGWCLYRLPEGTHECEECEEQTGWYVDCGVALQVCSEECHDKFFEPVAEPKED